MEPRDRHLAWEATGDAIVLPRLTPRARPWQVGYMGVSALVSWLMLRWALQQIDPNKSARAAVSSASIGRAGSRSG